MMNFWAGMKSQVGGLGCRMAPSSSTCVGILEQRWDVPWGVYAEDFRRSLISGMLILTLQVVRGELSW